jgi:hypothetical protein
MMLHKTIELCVAHYRAHMGRYLATTLLTGIANGVPAATISILWCVLFGRTRMELSVLNSNLRV